MMISSKGRYALRVMLDMAEHAGDSYIRLKDVAERQNISRKYLENIMPELARWNSRFKMLSEGMDIGGLFLRGQGSCLQKL